MPQFLDSENWKEGAQKLSALSSQGSSGFKGLEGIKVKSSVVTLESDEVTALCPVTGQPDIYRVQIQITGSKSIESKSLKLYFVSLRNVGMFCEDLAGKIRDDVFEALCKVEGGEYIHKESIEVVVVQKRRGGIVIEAVA